MTHQKTTGQKTTEPAATVLPGHELNMIDLPRDGTDEGAVGFNIVLSQGEKTTAAGFLRVREIRKARFIGRLMPWRKTGWRLDGRLEAVLVQDCVLTLAPVIQRISEEVVRRFLPEDEVGSPKSGLGDEPENPDTLATIEEDAPDPVGSRLDLAAIMLEALTLALDPYPKAEGAKLETSIFSAPGVKPMTDADARPFAKLATLKTKSADDN